MVSAPCGPGQTRVSQGQKDPSKIPRRSQKIPRRMVGGGMVGGSFGVCRRKKILEHQIRVRAGKGKAEGGRAELAPGEAKIEQKRKFWVQV